MPLQVKRVQLKLKDGNEYKDGDLLFNVDAEAWARGTRNGTIVPAPVTPDNNYPHAENNAEYYAEQAGSSASAAAQVVLTGNLAPIFNTTTAYSKGDYVIYNGKLYYFTANHAAGAWNNSHAVEQTVDDALKQIRGDISYVPIAINTFTSSVTSAEIGSAVNAVTLTYNLSKVPVTLTLDGTAITAAASGTQSLTNLGLTSNKTWTLVATDNGSSSNPPSSATKTATLSFMYKAFWGAAASSTLNSAFVRGLSGNALTTTRVRNITVNAANNQYIWYAVPSSFGECTFKVGGFEGGFEPAQTVNVNDAGGTAVSYRVYRSTNSGLGNTTINIT